MNVFKPDLLAGLLLPLFILNAAAADWPTWRYNAQRTAESPESLPAELHLQWFRQWTPLEPAFKNPRLHFDRGYEPIAANGMVFVGSSRNDNVTALDAATGEVRWRFRTDGPVRFAPVYAKGKLYVGSDDGFVYALDAARGSLIWKFRAAPSPRKILGNGRMISVWPVRGGPVLADGTLYFAAGVWPMEGVFVYAVDAETGTEKWSNDGLGYIYGGQPHQAEGFSGVTPQGYLVVNGDDLIVPCGTAYPALLDRGTGVLKEFQLPLAGRLPGGWFAAIKHEKTGSGRKPVLTFDKTVNTEEHEGGPNLGKGGTARASIRAGEAKLDFDQLPVKVPGTVYSAIVAGGMLFVSTLEGKLYGFGRKAVEVQSYQPETRVRAKDLSWESVGVKLGRGDGYALVLGVHSGGLIDALIKQTQFKVLVVEPDPDARERFHERYAEERVYGERVALMAGPYVSQDLPPYFASLIISEKLPTKRVSELFRHLRPFGGRIAVLGPLGNLSNLPDATLEEGEGITWIIRDGPLPGTSNYTGGFTQSPDELVKFPLGVLWFDDSLGHFKRSPQPLFVDGVMVSRSKLWKVKEERKKENDYFLGQAMFMDAYTGRVMSSDETSDFEKYVPEDKGQQPSQYRPPGQRNAWKPEPPQVGKRINPMTGKQETRQFPKSYGCDGGVDYGHIYTMRSASAAFYDKRVESGPVNISGPRSGCTNSAIPANGMLNVPYFYEGCTCAYPLPSGLALVNMPESFEQWTAWGDVEVQDIHRVGLNFGAPGDRITESGTLWLDVPSVGGPSPRVLVRTTPEKPKTFYRHALRMKGGAAHPWVAASGIEGVRKITVESIKPGSYTVHLVFADPGSEAREFDVHVMGREVMKAFSPGDPMRSVVKTFKEVHVDGTFELELIPRKGETLICGVELVASGLK